MFETENAEPACAIESATASTACQTNDSKFAYLLTLGSLGGATLLLVAAVILAFSMVSGFSTDISGYELYGNDEYEYFFEDEGANSGGDAFGFDTDSGTPA